MEKTDQKLKHIVIIPDGNRRWAKQNNKSYDEVYTTVALETTPALIKNAFFKHGVSEITFFMLSRNNMIKRSLDGAMPILRAQEKMYRQLNEDQELRNKKVKFKIIGDKTLLPRSYLETIELLESTNVNGGPKCNFLVAYDAEWEIAKTISKLKKIESADIVPKLLLNSEIDLMIRTGYEKRISGGPLIQLKYAELFFCDFHYPDLTGEKFDNLIEQYYKIDRRFGK